MKQYKYFSELFYFQTIILESKIHWRSNNAFLLMKHYDLFMTDRFICILYLTNKRKSGSQ